jgi:hypothetical protein
VNQIKKIHSNTVNIGQGWACGYYSLNEAATPITLPVLGGVTKKKNHASAYNVSNKTGC